MKQTALHKLLALACALALCLSACGKGSSRGTGRAPVASANPDATPPAVATPQPTPEPAPSRSPVLADPDDLPEGYALWGTDQVVEHIFFHPVIAYPKWAFQDCPMTQSQKDGLDDWMVTVDEYNKILQSIYEKGFVLVDINDVWTEVTDEGGNARMIRQALMVPQGKRPLIISYDDVNYYDYMLQQGFTSKLVIGDDGQLWAECTDPYTQETFLTQDLDALTILDKFVRAHPDFSPFGAKGCLSLTGYQGILGYRTQTDRTLPESEQAAWEVQRQKERAAVAPIIQKLKDTGWTFGSHTWGHVNLTNRSLEKTRDDTERWLDEVGSLVGETRILFYPHGARPDGGDDVRKTGPVFQYLQSQGFRVFASVGIESYSKIKSDISAVICDRLHPDGTTLRKQRDRYLQFYDAKDILDVDIRPDLGVKWND